MRLSQVMALEDSDASMLASCSYSPAAEGTPSGRAWGAACGSAAQRCMLLLLLAAVSTAGATRWQEPVTDVNLERYGASWPPQLTKQERAEIAMPEALKSRVLYDTELGNRRKLLVRDPLPAWWNIQRHAAQIRHQHAPVTSLKDAIEEAADTGVHSDERGCDSAMRSNAWGCAMTWMTRPACPS